MGASLRLSMVALALASFVLTSHTVRLFLPVPEGHGMRAKLEHYREHRDRYDLLFLGSSLIDYGVDPRVVDAGLAARGIPQRSFNLGLVGMRSFEVDLLVDELLGLEPAPQGTVVIEWPRWDARISRNAPALTVRNVRWHDARRTRLALASLARRPGPWGPRLQSAWTHVRLWAAREANLGQALALMAEVPPAPGWIEERLVLGGYQGAGPRQSPEDAAWHEQQVRSLQPYLARLSEANRAQVEPDEYLEWALRDQIDRLQRAGLRVVYVVPPGVVPAPHATRLADNPPVVVLRHNDPRVHPALFTPDARWDRHHLDEHGARLWSELLAECLAPLILQP